VALLDMDSHGGETSWEAMLETAKRIKGALAHYGLYVTAWKSSGGRGIHLYLIWDVPQDARSVRVALRDALTSCHLKPGTKGVAAGEVEVFPKQDRVPEGRFGSMFILPMGGGTKSALISEEPWKVSLPVPVAPPEPERVRNPVDAPELSMLRDALLSIPNEDVDYDTWRNYAFGVHHAVGDAGLDLVHEWSSRSPKYDPDFIDEEVWPYIRSDGENPITAATILKDAAAAGWKGQRVTEDMLDDALPEVIAKRNRFHVEQAAVFSGGAAPSWIIKGVLPRGTLGVVYGESGAGKSFFITDMLLAGARGVDWNDRRTEPVSVVYVAAEGKAGVRFRLQAYAKHHGIDLAGVRMGIIGDVPSLLSAEDVQDLTRSIAKYGRPDVVAIDTLAQVTAGSDENSSTDMGLALANCRVIADYFACMVILVHHAGKDASRGARGWSGLRGAADVEIVVHRDGERRSAQVTKLKDGVDGAEFEFFLHTVAVGMDTDGDLLTSCVVSYDRSAPDSGVVRTRIGATEQAILDSIELLKARGKAATSTTIINEAREQLPKGVRKQNIERSLEGLIERGKLERADGEYKLRTGGQETGDIL
jgi:KaiC/GvpD/RAD55 family RecA-like ATPase